MLRRRVKRNGTSCVWQVNPTVQHVPRTPHTWSHSNHKRHTHIYYVQSSSSQMECMCGRSRSDLPYNSIYSLQWLWKQSRGWILAFTCPASWSVFICVNDPGYNSWQNIEAIQNHHGHIWTREILQLSLSLSPLTQRYIALHNNWTVTFVAVLPLSCSTLRFKSAGAQSQNNKLVQCVSFNLRLFTSVLSEPHKNHSSRRTISNRTN